MHKIFVRCCECNKLLLKKYARCLCEYVSTSPCDGEYFISPACKKCADNDESATVMRTLVHDILKQYIEGEV